IRTARSRTSGEYLFDVAFVMMTPFSQELRSPGKSARFNMSKLGSLMTAHVKYAAAAEAEARTHSSQISMSDSLDIDWSKLDG
ncbi:hypothetical protein, partial [Jiella sp. M17.18]|uniref:hypothetical protein n=1 Tax=Jiella sp. M17.18 TaxID=3234247 RepID=UPI0034DEBC4E